MPSRFILLIQQEDIFSSLVLLIDIIEKIQNTMLNIVFLYFLVIHVMLRLYLAKWQIWISIYLLTKHISHCMLRSARSMRYIVDTIVQINIQNVSWHSKSEIFLDLKCRVVYWCTLSMSRLSAHCYCCITFQIYYNWYYKPTWFRASYKLIYYFFFKYLMQLQSRLHLR